MSKANSETNESTVETNATNSGELDERQLEDVSGGGAVKWILKAFAWASGDGGGSGHDSGGGGGGIRG